ncbi:MAG: hypothetical protein M1140_16580, partial [Chloroflexi bacterium]|nr:hypothetical protein [Chloroflexota bacterium]
MNDPDNLVGAGWAALQAGDWKDARTRFMKALQAQDDPSAHDGLGIALWWLNEVDAAHEQRTAAYIGYKREGALARAARLAAWLAREHVFLNGNASAMKGWFTLAERLLSQVGECPERGWFAIYRASMMASPAELTQVSQQTIEFANRFNDADLENFARAFDGMARVALGDVPAGMEALDSAMAAVTSGELADYMVISEVFCVTLSACELAGDLVRTEQWCRAAADYAIRHSCPFLSAYCRTTYGSLLTATGRWQEAESALKEAIRLFEGGHRALRIHALLKLAE